MKTVKILWVAVLTVILVFLVSCGDGGLNYDRFLKLLSDNGFEYIEVSFDTDYSFLSVPRRPLLIGDEIISVYEFQSERTMNTDAATISSDGYSIGNSSISWIYPPYFFKDTRLIVNYVGEDREIINFLHKVFGRPFAGQGS
ncbi:MAG: hypothetical protein FWD44_04325 [Oscillospiraceae bacterium]|nr:hypothetical protein [Oscillospiraceae bacterium]